MRSEGCRHYVSFFNPKNETSLFRHGLAMRELIGMRAIDSCRYYRQPFTGGRSFGQPNGTETYRAAYRHRQYQQSDHTGDEGTTPRLSVEPGKRGEHDQPRQ